MLLNFETELDRKGVKRLVSTPTPPPLPPEPREEIKIGSLCTGYGGLELAVGPLTGGKTVWMAEIDKYASKVLDERFPGIPNLGDFRDETPESVDVLTAGFPCQPVSQAGKRKGTDDERWLFDDILDFIGRMDTQPGLLMLENVPGLLTANGGRAMARVVQGLAQAGYVGRYGLLRASDVGACHQRRRWFCVAVHADADYRLLWSESREVAGGTTGREWSDASGRERLEDRGGASATYPEGAGFQGGRSGTGEGVLGGSPNGGGEHTADSIGPRYGMDREGAGGQEWERSSHGEHEMVRQGDRPSDAEGGRASGDILGEAVTTLPTPRARDYHGIGVHGKGGLDLPTTIAHRLPTPQARDYRGPNQRGDGTTLPGAVNLLPTPTVSPGRNATSGRQPGSQHNDGRTLNDVAFADWWGEYTDAIVRHEIVLDRLSPDPTITVKDKQRLNPAFVEWMMMLPAGWVTDVDISRTQKLKMLGNGVVPLQAYHAYRQLLTAALVEAVE